MPTWEDLVPAARDIISRATEANVMIATAESCTGGLIAGILTEISGSSAVVDRGFVTYSNEAKQDMLGVSGSTLDTYGAVSHQAAAEMADGALARSRAAITVAVTGIAGPGGGSEAKPVGTVYFGLAVKGRQTETFVEHFGDRGREQVRLLTVQNALKLVSNAINSST